jgi:hypothetical protein
VVSCPPPILIKTILLRLPLFFAIYSAKMMIQSSCIGSSMPNRGVFSRPVKPITLSAARSHLTGHRSPTSPARSQPRLLALTVHARADICQYDENKTQAMLARVVKSAREMLNEVGGCLKSAANAIADLFLSRVDLKTAPLTETADVFILIMGNAMYGNARRAVLSMLKTFREMKKQGGMPALALPVAAKLCQLSHKVLFHALETGRAYSSIEKICEVRDYLLHNVKSQIKMKINQQGTKAEKLAAIANAVKYLQAGNYHVFSEEQIDQYVVAHFLAEKKKLAKGNLRSGPRFASPAEMKMVLQGLLQRSRFESETAPLPGGPLVVSFSTWEAEWKNEVGKAQGNISPAYKLSKTAARKNRRGRSAKVAAK